MSPKGFAAKGVKLSAFAIALLMISSFGVEFMALGLVLGVAYAAYGYLPKTAGPKGQKSRSALNANLVMLGVGALAVLAVAMAFAAVPGPAPVAGADDDAARATATYKGIDYCKTCHGPGGFGGDQYTGWKTTNHGLDFTARDYHGSPINMFTRSGGSCQKCHVVGYNQTAIDGWDPAQAWDGAHNSKLQGIQCEACHGPGSEHNGGETGIIAWPTPAQSCAGDSQQGCHGPNPGHLTVPAWNVSVHSPADEKAPDDDSHYLNTNCAKCHSPSQYDPAINSSNPAYNISKEDFRGISCGDCHDMHNGTNERELTRSIDETCTKCHTADKPLVTPGKSPGHRTQKEMFLGTQGANVTGSKGMPGVTCADCHMWTTPSPARGYYLSDVPGYPYEFNQGHEFKASAEACADCHSDLILSMPNFTMPANNAGANATAYAAWEKWLPLWENEVEIWETVIEDWQNQIKPLLESATANVTAAKAAIDSAKANKTKDAATIARATELWGDAYWNYKMVEADSNYGAHNYVFASDLLNDALSKSKQALALINANSAPLANAGPSRMANTNQELTFDASASSDMDGTIASYFWDFGDGTNSTEMTAAHSFSNNGVYYVKLTVTDNKGVQGSAMISVFINNVAPMAKAGDDLAVELGAPAGFNASGSMDSDGTIEKYHWEFGDGETGTGAEATHTYASAGMYAVILHVTDDDGAVGMDTLIVIVKGPGAGGNVHPVASAGNDLSTAPDTKVSFNGSGSADADGTIQNYTWSFGDGAFGYGATADHTYARPGVYAVILTVTDDMGATGIDVIIVSVQAPPAPPVDLSPLQNNLTAVKNDLARTTGSIGSVQNDTAAMKKDVSDTKKSVDALTGNIGMYLAFVAIFALVVALVLYMVGGSRTAALSKELEELKARDKKAGSEKKE